MEVLQLLINLVLDQILIEFNLMNNQKIHLDSLLQFQNNKHQNSQSSINIIQILSSENNHNYELHLYVYIICFENYINYTY